MSIAPAVRRTTQEQVAERFPNDVAEHVMRVLKDDGLYRHLRFAKPGTYAFGFDIVTWPGHIAITGDMRSMTMARVEDMLRFVASDRPGWGIDYRYWLEKVVSDEEAMREWSPVFFREHVETSFREHVEDHGLDAVEAEALWGRVKEEVLCAESDARDAMEVVDRFDGVNFGDAWEWDCRDLKYDAYWRMHALRWAANTYFAWKVAQA